MTPSNDDRDDLLARLLASTERDAAPPDRAFLDRLREQSTKAFAASSDIAPGLPGETKRQSKDGH